MRCRKLFLGEVSHIGERGRRATDNPPSSLLTQMPFAADADNTNRS